MRLSFFILSLLLLAVVAFLPGGRTDAADDLTFNRDVRPILSNNCYECHGFDSNTREAGLRLDTYEGATALLESGDGRAIVPGNAAASLLITRVESHDVDVKMPPADTGKTLTPADIATLRKWIDQGARYERHWSFVAPKASPLPAVKQTAWPSNLIDHFILSRLEKEGLSPSPEADRRTLIRRVAFDVTGLPPTRQEIREFLHDNSDQAYERMVDRYLNSRSYGENMARRWLDLARYADTNGYQYDTQRNMWVWRDWVIHAYNKNMPFDQFTIEQLAGDLLPDATPHQVLATAFNRNHPVTIEGGVIDEEYRTEYVIDRLVTSTTVWMGMTIGCARCHDHKFDPISQKEFYQLYAYFNQVPERGLNGFAPTRKIASPLAELQSAEKSAQIEALKKKLASVNAETMQGAGLESWAKTIASSENRGWEVLDPVRTKSSGGSTLTRQPDLSLLVGGANPRKDIYEIVARTSQTGISAARLECLTHPSLPGGGPGRHTNSNFVLSEFELDAVSVKDPSKSQRIKFTRATADYSQANYNVSNTIDGSVAGNNGWAVDGPTRKRSATAMFVASEPFGFEGGTELVFRLRHEATFATHGIGRPRLSISCDETASIDGDSLPAGVRKIAAKKAEARSASETSLLRDFYQRERKKLAESIHARIELLSQADAASYPPTMVMQELPKPRPTHLLKRGQYDLPGVAVTPGVPASLMPLPDGVASNRLGFAKWLVDPKHPLTARVAVNRYWQQLFGTGLVKTPEDFGTQGEWPSHPALLDTLAARFVAEGWDTKAMLRLMLTSATYRQNARVSPELYGRDPENRLLARGPRFRLDAEQIRDQALAASGLLVNRVGGPSVFPYQPAGLWLELNNRPGYSKQYTAGKGEDLYRRSIYTFWKRTVASPMLTTFDAPDRESCTVRRSRTNTPLQALLLLQGPQFVEAARHLAQRMMTQGGGSTKSRIEYGFELTTARLPDERELKVLTRVYRERLAHFQQSPQAAAMVLNVGESPRDTKLNPAEHAAWTIVARLLLNLDETITRG